MFKKLLPKEHRFFELFEQQAARSAGGLLIPFNRDHFLQLNTLS